MLVIILVGWSSKGPSTIGWLRRFFAHVPWYLVHCIHGVAVFRGASRFTIISFLWQTLLAWENFARKHLDRV